MRPKSEIYTPKRDDEHPTPFHMRSRSPEEKKYNEAFRGVCFYAVKSCPRSRSLKVSNINKSLFVMQGSKESRPVHLFRIALYGKRHTSNLISQISK